MYEVEFSDFRIGDFRAVDFFGDGSFYLLDTPGHAVGHLAGLARTTSNPDTFILMGGDLCHHGGEIRPSPYVPLVPLDPTKSGLVGGDSEDSTKSGLESGLVRGRGPPCPGASTYSTIQHSRGRTDSEPFFVPAMGLSIPETVETIRKAQKADANPNILFVYAHDTSVWQVADSLFPAKANNWLRAGWRDKMFWAFLADFEEAAKKIETKEKI